jgi:hypothetical protein
MPKISYEEKELEILRKAVDYAEKRKGRETLRNPEIKEIIRILEQFLRKKKLVCYGGTAINNILPLEDQFYDKDIEIPDYDFYSPIAMDHAIELANIYYDKGFKEVEAKAGVHHGTYKVYVNFIPIADITFIEKPIFNKLQKNGIKMNGILYCPPNYLRMNMYLELSRPDGDISRWEKVLKRLTLLNKNYPLKGKKCNPEIFIRTFEVTDSKKQENLFYAVRDSFIDQGLVFFGGYASYLYSQYMAKKQRNLFSQSPDFDVLAEDPEQAAIILKERLQDFDYENVKIVKKKGIGEMLAPHYEIKVLVNKIEETVAFIYQPLACHSYNVIKIGKRAVRVATIDTMLNLYLSFIYANREYYDVNRILCMSEFLFNVQQKNRLQQKGLLKRFSINCYGKQETLEEMRNHKSNKFKELQGNKNSTEYQSWFLRYVPEEKKLLKTTKYKTKKNTKTKNINKNKNKNSTRKKSKK